LSRKHVDQGTFPVIALAVNADMRFRFFSFCHILYKRVTVKVTTILFQSEQLDAECQDNSIDILILFKLFDTIALNSNNPPFS